MLLTVSVMHYLVSHTATRELTSPLQHSPAAWHMLALVTEECVSSLSDTKPHQTLKMT